MVPSFFVKRELDVARDGRNDDCIGGSREDVGNEKDGAEKSCAEGRDFVGVFSVGYEGMLVEALIQRRMC